MKVHFINTTVHFINISLVSQISYLATSEVVGGFVLSGLSVRIRAAFFESLLGRKGGGFIGRG
jgi:hypothetical protein